MKYLILTALLLSIVLFMYKIKQRKDHEPEVTKGLLRDYQIEVDNDSIYIYDVDRRVGATQWHDNQSVDSIIEKDNQ